MYRQPQLFFPVHIYTMSNRVDTSAPLKSSSNYLSATTVQVPDSTPVKYSQQSSEQFATSPPPLAGSLYPKLDAEMRQAFIGPMSVEKFLNDFLPVEDVATQSTSLGFTELARATTERQMYGIFVCTFDALRFSSPSYDTPSRSTL